MKIKKFNERIEYNFPISEQKLREIDELKTQIEEFDQFFSSALANYLKIHPELQDEYDDFEDSDLHILDYWFLQESEFKYMFTYRTNDYKEDEYNEVVLDDKKFQDLLEYLQTPELYTSTRKYNL